MGQWSSTLEGVVMEAFWRNKTVLVTGHTGFKGSWLCLWLTSMGAKVVGYALTPPTEPNLFEVFKLKEHMTSVIGDVRDDAAVKQVFDQHQPEIVIHMAAQPLVRYSYHYPVETYATNVMGTVHVLEAARLTKSVKTIVNVTTDKCYENHEWLWGYRENEAMGGYDPYSNSKGCSELVTSAYRNSFFKEHGIGLASARAGNVIGGGDWAEDRLVPDLMRSCLTGQDVLIRNPHAIRPWQHVLEPLSGYLMLAQALHAQPQALSEAWNFGPNDDDAKPVQWIVDHVLQAWGEGLTAKVDQNPQPHEASFLKLDCSKAKARLHWQPKWSLAEALQHIVAWYQAYQQGADMRALSLNQIHQYIYS